MPTIAARCPKCKAVYRLKDASMAGKKMRCRKCQTTFAIPSGASNEHDGFGFDDTSGTDPYGRDVAFVRPGELPVKGRKIKKITKTVEPKKSDPEVDEEQSTAPASNSRRRRRKGKGQDKAEASAKKKKKKKKKSETTQQQKMIAIGGGVFVLVVLIVGGVFGPGIVKELVEGQKLVEPEKYAVYEPKDSELKIEYPEGWTISHGGGSDNKLYFMRIKHRGIEVFIVEYDPQKAAMNAALTGATFNDPDADPSVATHLRRLKEIQESNSDFEESPPQKIETGLGIVPYSVFTDPGMFSSTTGFRVTLADGHYTAYFRCSPKTFPSAKPIFEHMIKSIGSTKDDDDDQLPGL